MRWLGLLLPGMLLSALLPSQPALTFPPPKVEAPDKATLQTIETRTEKLADAVERLRLANVRDPGLADIEIYLKAAKWIVKHDEFFGKKAGKATVAVLDRGLLRASQQARGETPWLTAPAGLTVVRAYRSRIDGSLQPYAVTYPHDYAANNRKRYRMDVVLHGRDSGLTEVSFLSRHSGDKPANKDLDHVQVDIYGRGNNAYRWAGEQDVWEATENFLAVENLANRSKFIDFTKVVLRGFSMGGAGTWHLGLHRPDQFCLLGPGAGFTTTIGYVSKKQEEKLTDYQKPCLHIYDAVDYAENAFNVPIVAYSGENDPQRAAASNIEAKLKGTGIAITHLIAPGLKHQFPDEWKKKAEIEYARFAEKTRPDFPKVRFVTYTLKYSTCFWVELMALDRHYHRSEVDAEKNGNGFTVKTTNVRVLRLGLWQGATHETITVTIDGQKLENVWPYLSRSADLSVYLEKRGGKWSSVLPERLYVERLRAPQKTAGMQGPIDDAFSAGFLCVQGTGKPWNEAVEEHAKASLARFKAEWSKFLRGDLPIKDDTKVTAEDIATKNLILFGDPGSNSLIEQIASKLPFSWTQKTIGWMGKNHDAGTHVPVLIYPSPLATDRYIVLNSGHTFHADAFEGTNALLYPRLGDYALLKLTAAKKDPLSVEVLGAGLFDDFWRWSK